ncbi:WXG100 family type VII secretion target [Brachybacterium sp. AOP29-B2-41]|uniref:WXG100 family type VII secretion target n=1 Tax=Brachybacterium sp. AOP29-B2-41 TaxID=3457704 RepID=UPI004033D031
MGEFWGADTEQLQDLYRDFERGSDSMEDEFKRVGNSMFAFNRPSWEGPDADAFYAEWERISNEARDLYTAIEEMGRQLRDEAQEQDDVSEPEDGLWETLKDLGGTLLAGWGILTDTAQAIWDGLKEGRIDWPAFREGGSRLKNWWNGAEFDKKLGRLLESKGFKRISKLIPIVDIPLTIDGIINADDPVEAILGVAGLVGYIPHPVTIGIGLVADVISIADWAGEEFFDFDLSREVGDWFSDTMNDGFDTKRWNPLLV